MDSSTTEASSDEEVARIDRRFPFRVTDTYVKRFGSVTVLNGHIHQIMRKIEGKVSFHTAMSTAFPQPAPGTAPSAGPMKVSAEQLQQVLGITDVNYVVSGGSLAIVDSPLGAASSAPSGNGGGTSR